MSGSSLGLDLTIVSAKNLKNANRFNGDLSPYVVAYLDPNHKVITKRSSGSTGPVWNERFLLSFPTTPPPYLLALEIFHTDSMILVGSVLVPIPLEGIEIPASNQTFEVVRPSGRPCGTIEIRLALMTRPHPLPMHHNRFGNAISYNQNPAFPPTYPPPCAALFPFPTMPPQQYYAPPPSVVYALIPVLMPPQQSWHAPHQYYPNLPPGPTNIVGSEPPQQFDSHNDPRHEFYQSYYPPNPHANPALDTQTTNDWTSASDSSED